MCQEWGKCVNQWGRQVRDGDSLRVSAGMEPGVSGKASCRRGCSKGMNWAAPAPAPHRGDRKKQISCQELCPGPRKASQRK